VAGGEDSSQRRVSPPHNREGAKTAKVAKDGSDALGQHDSLQALFQHIDVEVDQQTDAELR